RAWARSLGFTGLLGARASGCTIALAVARCAAVGFFRGGRIGCGTTALASAAAAATRGGLFDQQPAFFEGEGLWSAILGDLRVLLPVGDIRAVAAIQHLDAVHTEVDDRAIRVGLLLQSDHFECAFESDSVGIVVLQGDVLVPVLHIRAEAAYVRNDC